MSACAKISPAFEPFLQGTDPNDKCEAIVIYEVPASNRPHARGRLRKLQQRLEAVKARADA